MVGLPFLRSKPAAATPAVLDATLDVDAASAPASWLRGARVVGPHEDELGRVTLIVRRSDGQRVIVVRRRGRGTRVLDLAGGRLDANRAIHVCSSADVAILVSPHRATGVAAGRHALTRCEFRSHMSYTDRPFTRPHPPYRSATSSGVTRSPGST